MNEQIEKATEALGQIEASILDMEEDARRPDLDARRDDLLAALVLVRENVRAVKDHLATSLVEAALATSEPRD
jgi:hypothetical protein